jgi:hypothetical protein
MGGDTLLIAGFSMLHQYPIFAGCLHPRIESSFLQP